ncbi:bifunctional D-glycero-beta-D-manno-heptose-7-phosphate kinase/D-glycero-beta-D-manno-heptose 1-phosphate adenylyltransferase HldE [Thiomicrorhabdus lithotrophica]|uniref:Bifunctional protein HldE n=1 Tax=Thiomicrorhabdus lithotrophica TaxID=2949997 RepID=A0ABY8CEK0_9GAMM|nr:bifunctional D-glycero-beta-D-manno-heptose-7-phosphate kinase/D-glycero-beta-D-manno-heptose 1-phosphate adenylyltransferase HldE [Thiomicrorhabdus lithotrophica]WEJ63120.1 bifunctional D-glycero-beta-D-manno-heptose-7-phosphate kinase/D-glycero-beta-D-manno-heptose 1-phosphate adenylyltransferase HldE [Thiomicrorhabdus lithotrophica]
MHDFSQSKILVVGDVMLDQYWNGRAGRISPEAPVPVVKVAEEEMRAGGAANVALNVAALGAQACLLGVVGKTDLGAIDTHGQQLTQLMDEAGVKTDWSLSDSGTICKLRVLSHHQQLIRMDFESPVPARPAQALVELVKKYISEYDVLVVSDYAKGALQFVEQMIEIAVDNNTPVLVDPKGLDFSRYRNATLIKPNQSEFEAIVGDAPDESSVVEKATQLINDLSLQALLVTRSEHGMALVTQQDKPYLLQSQAQEVYDVTGAGDTVMAALATGFASGLSWQNSVHLANQAASVVVRKVGTSTVSKAELDEAIKADMRHKGYVAMNEDELLELIQLAQKNGEKVVFTNGCFDLLHSGHVRYLNEAAKLGERLIIAVNSDESVKKLKGDTRPIVGLDGRMELLSALSCVDWVVAFNEETPERLICKLKPDVLVKGGDYKPEEIAGSKCVWDAGGQVEVLSFWDGYSTTSLVDKIQAEENAK